ncbi:hypothetical protein GKE56_09610 [Nostocoides sp. HKS02]|nr:hypothetical protein GKE56_09610 [Tetrasphaera sp. HKS02]
MPDAQAEASPVCASCGAVAPTATLAGVTWTRGTENGREVWTCERCSREHLRSIEGKLDSAWW